MLYFTSNGLTTQETTELLSLADYFNQYPFELEGENTGIVLCKDGEYERVDNEVFITRGFLQPCTSCRFCNEDPTVDHCKLDHDGIKHCPDYLKREAPE